MDKAEQRALAYAKSHAHLGYDYDQAYDAVKYGYLQAEKDLALTKDDVKSLIEIWMNLPDFPARSLSQIAEETLDIFIGQRNNPKKGL